MDFEVKMEFDWKIEMEKGKIDLKTNGGEMEMEKNGEVGMEM